MNLQVPFNETSIGQTSYNFFKAFYGLTNVKIFPLGNHISIGGFEPTEQDIELIKRSEQSRVTSYNREDPQLQIWHIQGSEASVSRKSNLFTFHETDTLTDIEKRILNNHDNVVVSSQYTKEVFEKNGVESPVHYVPLGFDFSSFGPKPKKKTDIITFGLRGKLESRKNTVRIIKAWVKRFGGNPEYRLDCSIHNFFYKPEEQLQLLLSQMPDQCLPWNVNLLPFCQSNKIYNDVLNNADIDLTGMSSCEGFNLPLFQSLCLGKHAVVLNAHVHRDYTNDKNAILVESIGMRPADDGKFFIPGARFNQGQWFDYNDSDFIAAMEVAVSRFKKNPINTEGLALAKNTFEESAKKILTIIS